MKKFKVALIGAGGRGKQYTDVMLKLPEQFEVVSVAEPIEERREAIKRLHNLDEKNCYTTWEDLLNSPKIADVAIVSTLDRMHYEPAIKAIEQGYHLLLEKPVTPLPHECMTIAKKAKENNVKIMVCHVLRYAPFYVNLKKLLNDGIVGDVVSIIHMEGVGNTHQSHSFVRGNWGNSENSSPMLLQKCCHDLDILQWLIDKKCKKIQSFGSLKYFTEENAPEGAPDYCYKGCPKADECFYNAQKLYLTDEMLDWFKCAVVGTNELPSNEQIEEALKTSPYGRCVFKCDNDVVDHQVVNMEFEDDITISFTMNAFNKGGRNIRIMGTKGEMVGSDDKESVTVYDFATRKEREIIFGKDTVDASIANGHGGGDEGIVKALYAYLTDECSAEDVSEIGISCKNHMMVFAAEKSRHEGVVVDMDEFIKTIENEI